MGQIYSNSNIYTNDDNKLVKKSSVFTDLCASLPPAPRTYSDDFWKQGIYKLSDREMKALEEIRQLELESLTSDEEKELKIREFYQNHKTVEIPLDIDENGGLRGFRVGESYSRDLYGEILDEYEETLIIYIGMELVTCEPMYLSGSGKLYIDRFVGPDSLVVVCNNCKDIGRKSSKVFQ